MQAELNVEGMNCNHCVQKVDGALKKVGVECKVDLATKYVAVAYDENKVSLNEIKDAIKNVGYTVV